MRHSIAVLFILFLFLNSCASGKFSLGEYKRIDKVLLSPDCKSAAVKIITVEGKSAIILDGARLGPWDDIVAYGFDSKSHFYAIYKKSSQEYLYYNGNTSKLEQSFNTVDIPRGFDGIALIFLSSYLQYLKVGGTVVGPYYSLTKLVFSETNNRWGAIVRATNGYEVWIDGKKQGNFLYAEGMVFSKDGGTTGYAFAKGNNAAIIVNDSIIAEGTGISGPWLNSHGNVYYYAKYSPSKIELYSNKVAVEEISNTGKYLVSDVYLSSAGRLLGYTLSGENTYYTVVNGTKHGPFDKLPDKTGISADGKNFVFYAEKNDLGYIYTQSDTVGPFAPESPARVYISEDGLSFYAIALGTNASYWIYSHKGKYGPYSYISDFSYSPDFLNFIVLDWDMTAYNISLNGSNIAVCSNECDAKPLQGGGAVIAEVAGNELIIRKWNPSKP